MKKHIISVFLAVCLLILIAVPGAGAMSLSNFGVIQTYNGEFSDVAPDSWYYAGIRSVYERGIMGGKGDGIFDPDGLLTIAETIKLAASLHKGYHTGSMEFDTGTPWYAPYVEYALENGIPVGAYRHYNAAATRSDFAIIIAGALPDEAVTPINRIADGAIPDVFESYSYGQAVYKLYRAGVLAGADSEGTFYPGRTLRRAEAAVMIMRIVDANTRLSFSLAAELTAEQIYKLASPAVFYVEVFDDNGASLKTGSGFFISESGLAVTNYHVVIGGSSAKITTDDGSVFEVAGIYDYSWKDDLSLIKIDVNNVPYLELTDSSKLQTGATVYTIGSPLGLQASYSRGIVSRAYREYEGVGYIQLDAAISSGSSGGALLDSFGRVVGVTSATFIGAQNLNLAMPINLVGKLSRDKLVPLKAILIQTAYYADFYPAPDFGVFFDVRLFSTDAAYPGTKFAYRLSDIQGDIDDVINEYRHLIEQNLFDRYGYEESEDGKIWTYYNYRHNTMITIGFETVRNRECFTVTVR